MVVGDSLFDNVYGGKKKSNEGSFSKESRKKKERKMTSALKKFLKKMVYIIIDAHPFLYRPEYKIYNHKIQINKTDKDIWPSYPHVHVIDDSLKLNIYTGEMYRIYTKKSVFDVSDKDMEKLWNDKKFLEIVMDARKNKPINVKNLEKLPFKWINEENNEWVKDYESKKD